MNVKLRHPTLLPSQTYIIIKKRKKNMYKRDQTKTLKKGQNQAQKKSKIKEKKHPLGKIMFNHPWGGLTKTVSLAI